MIIVALSEIEVEVEVEFNVGEKIGINGSTTVPLVTTANKRKFLSWNTFPVFPPILLLLLLLSARQ